MKCRLCGKGVHEIGGYLARVNEKSVTGIWECRPMCGADLPQETNMMLAITAGDSEGGQQHPVLGMPLSEVADVDWLRKEVQHLWCLLDDIDTASDIAKEDDHWYRQRVKFLQRQRFHTVTSDGYGLFVVPPNISN